MSWDKSAPEVLALLRDRLMADATIRLLFGSSFRMHYPEFDVTTDPMPGGVLFEEQYEAIRSASGESEVGEQNMLSAVFYFDPAKHSIGKVERAMTAVCHSLCEWEDEGLAIIKVRKTRATKPAESEEATDGDTDGKPYRCIGLMVWFE
jgi:hypothetical protein